MCLTPLLKSCNTSRFLSSIRATKATKATLATSEGWNRKPPKFIQRRASLISDPMSRVSNNNTKAT